MHSLGFSIKRLYAMQMTGEHRIQASRESNWAALSDRNTLHQAISGCGNIDKISDTELKAKIKVVVGPVAMKLADLLAVTTCLLR
ncbi:MAG: hypothetical protein CL394_05630 [Acidiferrobacteraceae bacterium]|nr:hypothetical protein [Acidiferrobacteraceae bacterium]